jgi:hypothetical protein
MVLLHHCVMFVFLHTSISPLNFTCSHINLVTKELILLILILPISLLILIILTPHRFIIIIELLIKSSSSLTKCCCFLFVFELLSLCLVMDERMLRLFEGLNSLLKHLLILQQFYYIIRLLILVHLLPMLYLIPQIFILIMNHKQFCILIINHFILFLNSLPQTQIRLQHLLHHIDCLNYTLSDGILLCLGEVGVFVGDLLECLRFLFKELFYIPMVIALDAMSLDAALHLFCDGLR